YCRCARGTLYSQEARPIISPKRNRLLLARGKGLAGGTGLCRFLRQPPGSFCFSSTGGSSMETISPLKKALLYVITLLVLPLLGIIAVEFAGRIIIHAKYGVPGKSYGLWQYDKELGAVHASNSYNSNSETNSLGFRNHEDVFEPKPQGALRIIAYGG